MHYFARAGKLLTNRWQRINMAHFFGFVDDLWSILDDKVKVGSGSRNLGRGVSNTSADVYNHPTFRDSAPVKAFNECKCYIIPKGAQLRRTLENSSGRLVGRGAAHHSQSKATKTKSVLQTQDNDRLVLLRFGDEGMQLRTTISSISSHTQSALIG